MIYVTGDCHGVRGRLRSLSPKLQKQDAVLLVAGDFGYIWQGEEKNPEEKAFLDTLARYPCTICFIDGNHEGFPALERYPEVSVFGSTATRIRRNLFWLRRGRIYTIQGKTFFCMGGAYSIDKPLRLAQQRAGLGVSWYPQELPSAEEFRRGIAALRDAGNRVDCILSHTAPFSVIPRLTGGYPDLHDRELTGFLDWIYHDISFKKWYFGHFHQDMAVNARLQACFQGIYCVDQAMGEKAGEKVPDSPVV